MARSNMGSWSGSLARAGACVAGIPGIRPVASAGARPFVDRQRLPVSESYRRAGSLADPTVRARVGSLASCPTNRGRFVTSRGALLAAACSAVLIPVAASTTTVEDNGPGIVKAQVPNVFGEGRGLSALSPNSELSELVTRRQSQKS